MRTRRITAALAVGALLVTACGGGETTDGEASAAEPTTSEALEIEAGDLYFDPEELTAAPGVIEMTLINVGAAEHDVVIEEAGDIVVAHAEPGETVDGSVELEAGTYTFYCSIPGHRSAMEGTLEVG